MVFRILGKLLCNSKCQKLSLKKVLFPLFIESKVLDFYSTEAHFNVIVVIDQSSLKIGKYSFPYILQSFFIFPLIVHLQPFWHCQIKTDILRINFVINIFQQFQLDLFILFIMQLNEFNNVKLPVLRINFLQRLHHWGVRCTVNTLVDIHFCVIYYSDSFFEVGKFLYVVTRWKLGFNGRN